MNKQDIVVGSIRFLWVEAKKSWMLPGGVGESRERLAIQYARRLNKAVNPTNKAEGGV